MKTAGEKPIRIGAILAGGQSRRMGRTKAAIRLPSALTFAEHACQILSPHVDRTVVLGHGEGAPSELLRIPDATESAGPVSGLLALLRSGLADEYLVLSCDMPFLTTELLALLLPENRPGHSPGGAGASPGQVSTPSTLTAENVMGAGFRFLESAAFQPFPLWLHHHALLKLEAFVAGGQKRWMAMLEGLSMHWVDVGVEIQTHFQNMNRPADLSWKDRDERAL